MDARLGKTQFVAGDEFSYGDIPAGIMVRRYMELVPERPDAAEPHALVRRDRQRASRSRRMQQHSADVRRRMDRRPMMLGLVSDLGADTIVYCYNGLIAARQAQGRVARMLVAHADVDHRRPLAEAGSSTS